MFFVIYFFTKELLSLDNVKKKEKCNWNFLSIGCFTSSSKICLAWINQNIQNVKGTFVTSLKNKSQNKKCWDLSIPAMLKCMCCEYYAKFLLYFNTIHGQRISSQNKFIFLIFHVKTHTKLCFTFSCSLPTYFYSADICFITKVYYEGQQTYKFKIFIFSKTLF